MAAKRTESKLRVVAHLRDHKLVKGYVDWLRVRTTAELVEQEPVAIPRMLSLRKEGSRQKLTIPLSSLKALFFVKTFEGRRDYKEVKFFDIHPPIEGLWVRIQFFDNEVSEGIVRNSLELLNNPGFYLKPPDPESNNEIVYALKSSLSDFRVLGVTREYSSGRQ